MKVPILIICLGVMIAGCKKSSNPAPKTLPLTESRGVITGIYLGPCPNSECGGIEITIPTSGKSQNYMIYSSMSKIGIKDSTNFPINVNLKWRPDTSHLRVSGYITVFDVQVIN
jgi:hypothetical protein